MIGSLGIKSGEPIIYREKRVENMKKQKNYIQNVRCMQLVLIQLLHS